MLTFSVLTIRPCPSSGRFDFMQIPSAAVSFRVDVTMYIINKQYYSEGDDDALKIWASRRPLRTAHRIFWLWMGTGH